MNRRIVVGIVAMAAVFVVAAGLAGFALYQRARSIREYLPAQPRIAGVSIGGTAVTLAKGVACRSFRFTAASAGSAADAARLFEAQLESEGWEKIASSSDGAVATSSWRHHEKINRGLYLVFAVSQLDRRGDYLASMTTAPYWPYP